MADTRPMSKTITIKIRIGKFWIHAEIEVL